MATLAAVLVAVLIATTAASLAVATWFHRQAIAQRGLTIEKEIERRVAVTERRRAEAAECAALAARNEAVAEAYRASLSEARALRLGRPPGWRGRSLEILAQLAGRDVAGRDPRELRDEAVACLGDIDIEEVARFEGGRGAIRTLAFARGRRRCWQRSPRTGRSRSGTSGPAGPCGAWPRSDRRSSAPRLGSGINAGPGPLGS